MPVKLLSRKFRGKLLHYLRKAYDSGLLRFPGKIKDLKGEKAFNDLLTDLYKQEWNVNCKPPFMNVGTVVDYLGRYTHRVAISNERIVKLEGDRVTIRYRDSAEHDKIKNLTLEAPEFIRRFLLHILPDGFVKIKHYRILSNRNRKTKLRQCRELVGVSTNPDGDQGPKESWEDLLTRITGMDPRICPRCRKGRMVFKEILPPVCGP